MASITLHNLDKELERSIRKKAKVEGTSLNKTIQKLLRQSLGIDPQSPRDAKEELRGFFGSWSDEEADAFNQTLKEMRRVDAGDWQ